MPSEARGRGFCRDGGDGRVLPMPMPVPVLALVLVLVLAIPWVGTSRLVAEIPPAQEFVAQTWQADHGLPQNSVQAFCQTRDGFLWIGTRFGLARFDGVAFVAYGPGELPGVRDGSVSALAEDGEGTLWIGMFDGLLRRRGGRFERMTALDGERVWALWSETPDRLWIGLNRGPVLLAGNGAASATVEGPGEGFAGSTAMPTHVRSLTPDGAGGLLVTTVSGWFRLDLASRGVSSWPPGTEGFGSGGGATTGGEVLPGDWRARAVTNLSPAALHRRIFRNSLLTPNDWGPRTAADGQGGWWFVAQDRSLFHLDGTGLKELVPGHRQAGDGVLAVASDRDGNHWIGHSIAGMTRLRPRLFRSYAVHEGDDAPCFTVALGPDGEPWTASRAYVLQVGGGRRRLWPLEPAASNRQIFAMAPSAEGGWWLGWDRRGLHHWLPSDPPESPRFVAFEGERPRALAVARDGALWIGLTTGLARWDRDGVRRFGVRDGLPHPDVRAIHEDRSGRLWVATFGGGIARLSGVGEAGGEGEGPGFVSFSVRDGLGADTVWGFHEDRRGALWIYGMRGLTRWNGHRLATVTREHGLFDDLTNQLLEDEAGYFWLGCNRGIYRVHPDELHAVADGRAAAVTSVVYTAADGLPIAETNGESQPAGARSPDGALWFPTPVGLLRVDPRRVPLHETPPTVHLTRIRTESLVLLDETADPPGTGQRPVRIPSGEAHVLEAEFTSPHFAAPERVRFRQRLHGYETNWVEGGSRRSTRYTNLRPGRYRLEVTACNSHGLWATEPAVFAFEITPRLHQHAFFLPVLGAAGLLAAVSLHRLRVRLVTRHHALQGELRLARERERIARDMHDDVGASLTQIGLLAARTEQWAESCPPEVPSLLRRIGAGSREAAQAMEEIVWALNPRNDRLDHLADFICQFARDYLEPTGIRCRLEVPPLLPDRPVSSDQRHHVLMMLKECLGNAARHSAAREVRVGVGWHEDVLHVAVADDGRGFEVPSDLGEGVGSAPAAGGNGLRHLHRRVAALGGSLRIASAPGQGTTVDIRLPLSGD